MKLSIIYSVMNQHRLARTAIGMAVNSLSPDSDAEVIVIDNGSDEPFMFDKSLLTHHMGVTFKVVRNERSTGVYPTLWQGMAEASGDILAFFHSDLIISQDGWDKDVLSAFERFPKAGLLGFVGSNEIDGAGGRGLGTMSSFQGGEYQDTDALGNTMHWKGSPAEVHGKRIGSETLIRGAVVDGCTMIFRRECLADIKQRENFPPHHFYDKLLSCEVREHGYDIYLLSVACDHISGQTVNQEQKYHDMGKVWLEQQGIFKPGVPVDQQIYERAQYLWISEYRERKHLIPCKI